MAAPAVVAAPSEAPVEVPLQTEQSLKAAKALLAHITKTVAEPDAPAKRNLLEDGPETDAALAETPIWLNIVSKRHIVSKPHLRPSKVYLPHPLNTKDTVTICLITADPQRAYKDHIADSQFPEGLRRRITRVIGFKKLQAKFSAYEAQRALYAAHEVFLADDRIVNRLPAVLGKTFFKNTTKRPIPVIISANPNSKKPAEKTAGKKQPKTEDERATSIGTHEQVAREIERALGAALVTLNPSPQICVKVGHANMSPEDLAENLNALALAVVDKHVPQKWKNVKGVFVKGPETAALPIWQTDALWLEGKDVVKGEEGKKAEGDSKKRKARGDDEEEASAEGSPMPKKARKAGGAPAAVEAPSAASPLKAKKNNKGVKAKPKGRKVPDSNDGQLDKQISDRKAKLRQQKRAARAADDD